MFKNIFKEKINKVFISVAVVLVFIIGLLGAVYISAKNDYDSYRHTAEDYIQNKDMTYQEKIFYLMQTLDDESEEGLKSINFKLEDGKTKHLSLNDNTKYYNLFRGGMIDGMIAETDEQITNGIAIMFEEDNTDEVYNEFKEKSIEKFNDEYVNIATEYKNVLLQVEEDFKDGVLDNNYDEAFKEIDWEYQDLMEDYASFMGSYIWNKAWGLMFSNY